MGMTAVFAGMQVGGTIAAAQGQRAAGSMAQRGAELEALQMQKAGGQAVAASQRDAAEQARQSRLLQSRALALAAAGGGASDPTVVKIVSDLAGEGAYRQALALYGGEEHRRALETGAVAKQYEGVVAKETGNISATSTLIRGFGSVGAGLYGKYGAGGFGKYSGSTTLPTSSNYSYQG